MSKQRGHENAFDAGFMDPLTSAPNGTTFVVMDAKNNGSASAASKTNGGVGERAGWLKGVGADCEGAPAPAGEARRLVLLGAPGVGKGTQADLMHQWCGACHLSTGDIFRAA